MNPFDFPSTCSSANGDSCDSGAAGHVKRIDPFETPAEIRILTFSGPSGAGKTTVIDALMRLHPEFERVISCTTRPRRPSDPLGEYTYVSEDEFDGFVKMSAFLWTNAYAGHRYGTLSRSVWEALSAPHPRIMTLTPDKTVILRKLHPKRILSFLITASEDTIQRRLLERGDSPSQVKKRLAQDREWARLETFVSFSQIIIMNERDGGSEDAARKIVEALRSHHVIA